MQPVIHKPAFPADFNKVGELHDFEVVRDVDDFCFQTFSEVGYGQFAISEGGDNPEPVRIAERFESFGAEINVKLVLRHKSPWDRQAERGVHVAKAMQQFTGWMKFWQTSGVRLRMTCCRGQHRECRRLTFRRPPRLTSAESG